MRFESSTPSAVLNKESTTPDDAAIFATLTSYSLWEGAENNNKKDFINNRTNSSDISSEHTHFTFITKALQSNLDSTMVDRRTLKIYDLVKEVSENSWIINEGALITRHHSKPAQPYWEDGEGRFFTMEESLDPRPFTRRISDSCPITDACRMSTRYWGFFKIGQAYLNVSLNFGAQQHNTLAALAKRSLDFMIPTEYCHGVYGLYYYIVHSILPGKSIAEVLPKTDDDAVKAGWGQQIAEAYDQLSKWHGDRICGVDGGNLGSFYTTKNGPFDDFSIYAPDKFQKNYEEVGLDCSEFVFAHNHMMPLAFMLDESNKLIGINFWGDAGFVPKDLVRTVTRSNSFRESVVMCNEYNWTPKDQWQWKRWIDNPLGEKGFREFWYAMHVWSLADDHPNKALGVASLKDEALLAIHGVW
ncbi:hypothetical protein FAUST_8106 [Fusarium austroamericanum]|uniref:Uncharacterized protein n=1 Tax=Fusarium austroamericanum TaxID=282268 RepID=A0AAN5Z5D3_FUSAU|nr:hypothetical protein FAUST_8106 [Fusarium austroamericanum]